MKSKKMQHIIRFRPLLAAALLFTIHYPLFTPALQAQVTLSLPWLPQAQFAGVYVAMEKGFFQEAGLEVKVTHASGSMQSLARPKVAKAEFFVDHLSAVMLYNDTTTRDTLLNILQTAQHAAIVIVSHDPLPNARALQGKRVACWARGRNETAMAYLKAQGVDVEWVPTESYNNAPFLAGAVDATFAMEYNELFLLQLNGRRIAPSHVLKLRDTPFDIPADGLYVKASYLRAHPAEAHALAAAVRRGWEWLAQEENRDEGLRIVVDYARRHGIRANQVVQRHMLASVLERQTLDGRRPFSLDRARFERVEEQLRASGLIRHPVDYASFIHCNK